MGMTRMSSKGQIVIPKAIRDATGWGAGVELEVEERNGEVVLRPTVRKKKYTASDLIGFLKYDGPPVSIEDMQRGIDAAMEERWARKSGKAP